jgi:hypothetical protein
MNTKNWLLILVAVGLATAYGIFFTDWFQPQTVKIFHTSRRMPGRAEQRPGQASLLFALNRPLKLTEVKVVPLAAYQTNQNTLPLWHLVSDSNSVPVKAFFYGQMILGLKPVVPGTRAQPLTNNVIYRLLVAAGQIKGEHDFELK